MNTFIEEASHAFDSEHWIIYTNLAVALVSIGVVITTYLGLREEHRHSEHLAGNSQDSEERIAHIALAAIRAEAEERGHNATPTDPPTN